jgi:ABC-type multidrug transport system permease subunit
MDYGSVFENIQDIRKRLSDTIGQNGKTTFMILFLLLILTTALFITLYIFVNKNTFSSLNFYALIVIIVSCMCIILSGIMIYISTKDKDGIYFALSCLSVFFQIMELIGDIQIYSTIN